MLFMQNGKRDLGGSMENGPCLLSLILLLPLPLAFSSFLPPTRHYPAFECLMPTPPQGTGVPEAYDSYPLGSPAYPQCLEPFTMHMALVCICKWVGG